MNCSTENSELPAKKWRSEYGFVKQHKLTYGTWLAMKNRCFYKTSSMYKFYGAKGITICDRWLMGTEELSPFECFIADMGDRPGKEYSIDRIDGAGNYTSENCRWATRHEQALNRINSSSHMGVVYDIKFKMWRASLIVNKRYVLKKYYATKNEAWAARQAAELKYLGVILQP